MCHSIFLSHLSCSSFYIYVSQFVACMLFSACRCMWRGPVASTTPCKQGIPADLSQAQSMPFVVSLLSTSDSEEPHVSVITACTKFSQTQQSLVGEKKQTKRYWMIISSSAPVTLSQFPLIFK